MRKRMNALALPFWDWLRRREKRRLIREHIDVKYEFVEHDTLVLLDGTVLRRIRALIDIPNKGVKAGDLGGYLQSERNLSHNGTAWVGGWARVYGEAQVFGKARVYGEAWVFGKALVGGEAQVNGWTRVFGDAQVYGNALVSGWARVFGEARVCGNAQVYGDALVYGNALVSGCARVFGEARVFGDEACHD